VASSYPTGLDSLAKPTSTTLENAAGFEHDVVHTDAANAVEAVQSTLGTNPQGGSATVKARLDTLDTTVSGKAVATRTISTTAPLSGGGDLSADRTLTIADGTTSVKGAVQLETSTTSTSTTTAATPSSVKSAYDFAIAAGATANNAQTTANAAVPKSTVTTLGDLIYGTGSSTVGRLAKGSSGQVLTASAFSLGWETPATYQDEFLGAYKTTGGWWLTNTGAFNSQSVSGKYQVALMYPVYFPEAVAVDRVAVEVTTLGTGVVRLGLYAHDNATGRPGSLLFDWGTASVTSTGVKEVTISSTIPAGWAWLACAWQTTNTTAFGLRATSLSMNSNSPVYLGTTSASAGAVTVGGSYEASSVTGAFTTLGSLTLSTLNNYPRFQFRTA